MFETNNYCTLFNSSYMTRGLAMYESLAKVSSNFHLYVFSFDDHSYEILKSLRLPHTTIISLEDFEDDELLSVKKSRTIGEYCWTCTPSVIKYAIEEFQLDHCTYLDADLYFFSDPANLVEEMTAEEKSVLITEHRYTKEYDQTATSGRYCVQFMTFLNDTSGMEVLRWWKNACIEWCFNRFENGKFGDQKYLDDWTTRFDCIHVLNHLGGGVAPWNIQQYEWIVKDRIITGVEVNSGDCFPLVFYHFHNFNFRTDNKVSLGIYKFRNKDLEVIYKRYTLHLLKITSEMEDSSGYDYNNIMKVDYSFRKCLSSLKRIVKGTYNIIKIDKFTGYGRNN